MSQRAAAVFEYLEAVSTALFVLKEKQILWANSAAASLTGWKSVDLHMMNFSDLIAPAWRQHSLEDILELDLLNTLGESIPVGITFRPAEIDDEQVAIITLKDIRERKRLENTNVYRQAVEGSIDGFYLLRCVWDDFERIVDFTFADVNERGEMMTPYTRDQLIGQNLCELFPTYRTAGYFQRYAQVVETGNAFEDDFEFVQSDGTRHWYHHQVVSVDQGLAVFSRSVTERKLAEDAQRESELRYQALLNQSNDCVSLLDLNGYYILANQQLASILGYTVEEMIGMHLSQVIAPSEVSHYRNVDQSLQDGSEVPLFDRLYRRKDGSEFHGEVNISLVRAANGTPLYVQSIMRDVTWRLQTEQALRESEERYRIISELISDYAYAFNIGPDGTPTHEWITDSFKRMTGFTHDEIDAQGQFALYHPSEEQRVDADMKRVEHGEAVSGEYRIITKSGELRWVHIFRQPVWDEVQQRVIRMYGVAQDITERKKSEEELRKSEEKYRLIAENVTDMISRTNLQGIRTYVSSASRAVLGYEPEELTGKYGGEIIHPEDLPAMRRIYAVLQEATEPLTLTLRLRHKNGEYVWFEVTSKTLRDPLTGAVQEFFAVSRDVSHRRQMEAILIEQERLRVELQKEQELSEIKSKLMRTISHEFRTPLTLIATATDFLDTYIEHLDTERRQERLQAIHLQVNRLSEMLDDISFVVQGTLHHMVARPSRINLESYCRTTLEDIKITIGQNRQFVFITDDQLQEGFADKALIVRIMSNLLSNAVKYSPENSIVTVKLYRDSDNAVIQVSDQGIGIAPEEQKHIFEAFYRSSDVIDQIGGTGLGLSIVKDCIALHDGTISLESELGKGTTFTVRLPQPADH